MDVDGRDWGSLKETVRVRVQLLGRGVAIAVSVSELKDRVLRRPVVRRMEEEEEVVVVRLRWMRLMKGMNVARQPAVRPMVSSTTDQMVGAVADPVKEGMLD